MSDSTPPSLSDRDWQVRRPDLTEADPPTLADLPARAALAGEIAAQLLRSLAYRPPAPSQVAMAAEIRRLNLLAVAAADDLLKVLPEQDEPKEMRPWCPACGKFCHEVVDASVAGPALRTSDCCEVLTQRRPWPALTPAAALADSAPPALDLAGIRRALGIACGRLAGIDGNGSLIDAVELQRIIDARNGVAYALQLLDAAGG